MDRRCPVSLPGPKSVLLQMIHSHMVSGDQIPFNKCILHLYLIVLNVNNQSEAITLGSGFSSVKLGAVTFNRTVPFKRFGE